MKRYLLFAGDNYYPDGGWNDFRGDFDTKEEADRYYDEHKDDDWGCDWNWMHVIDVEDREYVTGIGFISDSAAGIGKLDC